jgi:hypothetical protein
VSDFNDARKQTQIMSVQNTKHSNENVVSFASYNGIEHRRAVTCYLLHRLPLI